MTREEIINEIKLILEELDYPDAVSYLTQNDREWLEAIIKALEQMSCEDVVYRQAVLEQTYNWSKDEFLRVTNPFDYLRKRINSLLPVNLQLMLGCEGCIYKKTGNNSTYPCSHCGRYYTDKYKAGSDPQERSE